VAVLTLVKYIIRIFGNALFICSGSIFALAVAVFVFVVVAVVVALE
jgi:hypothetical protein